MIMSHVDPNDHSHQVCTETIYRCVYAQPVSAAREKLTQSGQSIGPKLPPFACLTAIPTLFSNTTTVSLPTTSKKDGLHRKSTGSTVYFPKSYSPLAKSLKYVHVPAWCDSTYPRATIFTTTPAHRNGWVLPKQQGSTLHSARCKFKSLDTGRIAGPKPVSLTPTPRRSFQILIGRS